MYIQVTCSIFHDQFQRTRPENFTYAGLNALYDFLTDMGGDHDCELDVIAICCDLSQYDSIEKACDACGVADREELEGHTTVLDCDDGSVIIQNF